MYIETSYPRKQGQKARLLSPAYTDNSDICVKFWYHMYGNGIGTLNVYAMVGYRHILFVSLENLLFAYQYSKYKGARQR